MEIIVTLSRESQTNRRPQVRPKLNKTPPFAIFHEMHNGCRATTVVNNDLCSYPPIRKNVGSSTFDLTRNRMISFFFNTYWSFYSQAAAETTDINRRLCWD